MQGWLPIRLTRCRQRSVSGGRPSPAGWAATHAGSRREQGDLTKSEAPRHPRSAVIVPFTPAHRVPCAITTQCQILEASCSGSEAWGHRPPRPRARRVERMRAVLAESGARDGRPKIAAVLRPAGERMRQNTGAQWRRDLPRRSRVTRNDQATTPCAPRIPGAGARAESTLDCGSPACRGDGGYPGYRQRGGLACLSEPAGLGPPETWGNRR
jgi:hypothetical protein